MLHSLGFLSALYCSLYAWGEVSLIAPSRWFVGKIREAGVPALGLRSRRYKEVVLLTRNSREATPWWEETTPRKVCREPIDYTDTSEANNFREAIRHLNRFLSGAGIDFLDDGLRAPRRPLRSHPKATLRAAPWAGSTVRPERLAIRRLLAEPEDSKAPAHPHQR